MECQRKAADLKRICQQNLPKTQDPVEKFKYKVLSQAGFKGIKNIARKLRIADRNGDRRISWDEFKWICVTYKLGLTDQDMEMVFCHFDKDGSGFMDYEEFLFAVRPPMSKARQFLAKMAFVKMDKTGDGVITVEDLIKTYNAKKHPKYLNGDMTEREVMNEFLKSFDVDDHCKDTKDDEKPADPVVTIEDWMNYFAGVSVSIDEDAYFNLMMRNAWKLD